MWCCVYIVYEATVEKYKPMLWVSSAGSLTPTAVSSYMRTKKTYHKKTPHTFKHFKRCLGITLATMTDLQADNGVDCHQGFYQYQYRSFALTEKDTLHKWLFLTTALPESSSIFFQPVTMLVSTMFLLCQSEMFHQSGRVTTFLLLRVLICPPSTADSDSAVLSLFSSPMEHVLSTINIGRLCAKSRPPKLDSSLKRKWSASRDASQHRL